ncbi:glycerol-3-phosphate 1-O-acyltransferase PlsY [Candidatus Solincola tengchongensis]|uniref:glycerol-3-phosphate 1-O-acyltransferase PlsY n=1 Tax=Candidatus Solincola tengchongensis TaxID=2900693 RepID=UPI00257B7650|nr:glycerol-3-phosphate 1-O-acyltransferase PlsY [Candidatus Solincola tengchongensis]
MAWKAPLWLICAYLLGSIPFGYLVSRLVFKSDIRRLGSGNIGATNVLRNFGVRPFIAVTLLDMGKGVAAVAVGRALGLGPGLSLLAGLLSIVGHNWSLYLGFKGGKGIATSGGVIIAAYPWQVTAAVLGTFLFMVVVSRIMSVGSISAAVAFPVAAAVLLRGDLSMYWPHLAVSCLASIFAVYRHRENIGRLLSGKEPRISLPSRKTREAGT